MGQNGHARTGARSLLAVGAVVAASFALGGCDSSLTNASSTLSAAHGVTVVDSAGHTSVGTVGESLPAGDEVLTSAGGSATITTRNRSVTMLGRSALVVTNGAKQSLQRGGVVVDAVSGDGVAVAVADYDVTVPAGSATRIVRGVSSSVGSLIGQATVINGEGAALSVPALTQAAFGGDALPTTTTALHLTDDAAEAAAAAGLVRDDELLNTLARGIDDTGAAATHNVDASWRSGGSTKAVRGTARSNRVLPIVLAKSVTVGQLAAYRSAVTWRSQGGSWGVIAHRLDITAAAASTELSSLERSHGTVGSITAADLIAGAGAINVSLNGGHHAHGTHHAGSSKTGQTAHHHHQSGGSTSNPKPSPSPSQGLVGSTLKTLKKTVHNVLKLLPVGKGNGLLGTGLLGATTTATPSATPAPTKSSKGLLGLG